VRPPAPRPTLTGPHARRRGVAAALGATMMALTAAGGASAQVQVSRSVLDTGIPFELPASPDRVTVAQRPHPELDPLGIRAGGFLLFPMIDIAANGTSNVFGSTDNAEADGFLTIEPRIDVRSQWSRHAFSAHADGNFHRYAGNPIKNESGYDVGADARLDVMGQSSLRGAVNVDRIYINQFSGDFPQFAAASVPLDRQVASLRATYVVNRLRFIGDANVTRLDFSDAAALDGRLIDQDFLDRTVTRLIARSEYSISPVTSLFVQGNYVIHDFRRASLLDRSGTEVRVIGGAAFDLTPLIRTRVGVGYLTRGYDAPGVANLSGIAFDVQADYLVTQLTTISLAARRDVRDAAVVDSPGYTSARVALGVDHELLRNLILTGRADLEKDDFSRVDRRDTLFHVGGGAYYTLNRNMVVAPTIDYSKRDSTGDRLGQRFNEIRGGLSLTLRR
jgi:hypothetical protein